MEMGAGITKMAKMAGTSKLDEMGNALPIYNHEDSWGGSAHGDLEEINFGSLPDLPM